MIKLHVFVQFAVPHLHGGVTFPCANSCPAMDRAGKKESSEAGCADAAAAQIIGCLSAISPETRNVLSETLKHSFDPNLFQVSSQKVFLVPGVWKLIKPKLW